MHWVRQWSRHQQTWYQKGKAIYQLTHWGRFRHKCVNKLTIIVSDNGLSSSRHQAIIWTNAVILLIRTLGTNLSEISIEILTFLFKKKISKVSPERWWPSCIGLSVLTQYPEVNAWVFPGICRYMGCRFLVQGLIYSAIIVSSRDRLVCVFSHTQGNSSIV